MEKYDYYDAMFSDIETYIKDNNIILRDTDFYTLYDEMFTSDEITGNASGSYTFNYSKACENLLYNEDLLCDACEEFYGKDVPISVLRDPETCDVIIRCYLLSQVLNAVIGSIEDDMEEYYIAHNMNE